MNLTAPTIFTIIPNGTLVTNRSSSDVYLSSSSTETGDGGQTPLDSYRMVAMIIGILINLLIICVVIKRKAAHKLIGLNLLVTNILICLLSAPFVTKTAGDVFQFNVVDMFRTIPIWASNHTIMAFLIFTYVISKNPNNVNVHYKRKRNFALYAWIISFLAMIVYYLTLFRIEYLEIMKISDTSTSKFLYILLMSFSFILPAIVTLYSYYSLGQYLYSTSASIFSAMATGTLLLPLPIFLQGVIIVGCCSNIKWQIERYTALRNEELNKQLNCLEEEIRRPAHRRRMIRGFYNLNYEESIGIKRLSKLINSNPFSSIPCKASTDELHDRHSLSKSVKSLSIIFILFLVPYCILMYLKQFSDEVAIRNYATTRLPLFLFLSQCYAIINPLVYLYQTESIFNLKSNIMRIANIFSPKTPQTPETGNLFIVDVNTELPQTVPTRVSVESNDQNDDITEIVEVKDDSTNSHEKMLGSSGQNENLGRNETPMNTISRKEQMTRYSVPGNLNLSKDTEGMEMPEEWV